MARPEREEVEPVRPRDERMLVVARALDDAVEGPYLVHSAVLPGEPRAGEDEEELLGRAVRVRRRR